MSEIKTAATASRSFYDVYGDSRIVWQTVDDVGDYFAGLNGEGSVVEISELSIDGEYAHVTLTLEQWREMVSAVTAIINRFSL